jgi:hypothetical protein
MASYFSIMAATKMKMALTPVNNKHNNNNDYNNNNNSYNMNNNNDDDIRNSSNDDNDNKMILIILVIIMTMTTITAETIGIIIIIVAIITIIREFASCTPAHYAARNNSSQSLPSQLQAREHPVRAWNLNAPHRSSNICILNYCAGTLFHDYKGSL